jgi:hypothetical protein
LNETRSTLSVGRSLPSALSFQPNGPGVDASKAGPSIGDGAGFHYRSGGWPVTVEGDAFTAPYSAPSAGPPPWHLYRLTLRTAVGLTAAEPYGATRWDF